jgi:hypothetical protein
MSMRRLTVVDGRITAGVTAAGNPVVPYGDEIIPLPRVDLGRGPMDGEYFHGDDVVALLRPVLDAAMENRAAFERVCPAIAEALGDVFAAMASS